MFNRRAVFSVLVLASITGCRLFRPIDPNAGSEPAEPQPAESAQPAESRASEASVRPRRGERITDANIAAMVLASNNTDISYARLVPSRSQRNDVKQFAQRMLTDHVGVNALVTETLEKIDLAAEDNTASLDMRDESANKRDLMRELTGYKFDSTYIENEVSYHQRFLASIDEVMSPIVRNEQLRMLLTSIRPAVAAHLAHAEQVRADVLAKK
jgi:putative membrane protein